MIGLPSSVTMPRSRWLQFEMNLLARTRIQMNAFKSAKSNTRSTLDRRELEIELHHLVAGDLAGVRHRHVGADRLSGSNRPVRGR